MVTSEVSMTSMHGTHGQRSKLIFSVRLEEVFGRIVAQALTEFVKLDAFYFAPS